MDQYDHAACTTDISYAIRQLRQWGDVQRALDALDRVAARLGVVVVLDDAEAMAEAFGPVVVEEQELLDEVATWRCDRCCGSAAACECV